MSTTATASDVINALNDLLRGYRSAVETYDKAIDELDDSHPDGKAALVGIRDDHRSAVDWLTSRVTGLGGEPATGSGAWGAFANLTQSMANLFGDSSALASLKQGEEHGLNECESAIDKGLDEESRDHVTHELIPKQRAHIQAIEGISTS
jgi:DNA-binding ferritin-like protein